MKREFYYLENQQMNFADFEDLYLNSQSSVRDSDYMYKEIFHCTAHTDYNSDYERNGCHIKKGDHVIDVGGNIGMFARLAHERGAEKIISFEPQRSVFACFVRNMTPEMEPYCLAISDENSVSKIEYNNSYDNTGGGSIVSPYEKDSVIHSEKVMTMTLDRLFETGVITKADFLKIDCEGAELKVLNGINDENLLKFRCIAIEIHRTVLSPEDIDKMLNRIDRLGYQRFTMYWGGGLIMINCWK